LPLTKFAVITRAAITRVDCNWTLLTAYNLSGDWDRNYKCKCKWTSVVDSLQLIE